MTTIAEAQQKNGLETKGQDVAKELSEFITQQTYDDFHRPKIEAKDQIIDTGIRINETGGYIARKLAEMVKAKGKRVDYVCKVCVEKAGGKRPKKNRGWTMMSAPCDACGIMSAVGAVSDWVYPKGKPREWKGMGRD